LSLFNGAKVGCNKDEVEDAGQFALAIESEEVCSFDFCFYKLIQILELPFEHRRLDRGDVVGLWEAKTRFLASNLVVRGTFRHSAIFAPYILEWRVGKCLTSDLVLAIFPASPDDSGIEAIGCIFTKSFPVMRRKLVEFNLNADTLILLGRS